MATGRPADESGRGVGPDSGAPDDQNLHDGDVPPAPGELRLAALIICLQALGLLAATVVLLIKTGTSHSDDLGRAFSDAGFALIGAVLLVWAARSILALRPASRTPLIVLELLALPVGWSLGFQAGRVGYAAPLLLSALAVLYLLFTPPARRVLERRF